MDYDWYTDMGSRITAEEAARQLDSYLRGYPWYLSVGVGEAQHKPILLVYIKTTRSPGVQDLADEWQGFEVIKRPVGNVRAL